jgi:hypothetical protein
MHRNLAILLLFGLLVGCTRYGTNPQGGPFARKPKSDADAVPPAPAANNSPLAMGAAAPVAGVAEEPPIVPPRPPESARQPGGSDSLPPPVLPGSASLTDGKADPAASPWRRQPESLTDQTPSPFAKDAAGSVRPAAAVSPATPSPAAMNIAEVKKLAVAAAEKWAKVSTYEAIVTRRELIPTKEMSSDLVYYQYRKEPMSVFIKNIGDSGKGRELIYNSKTDKIHVMLGEGDHKLMPAGFKAPAVTPDDPRVKDKSRYSIRDAGYGTPINRLNQWVAKAESGRIPPDALTFMGKVERKEYPYPLIGVSLKLRPGDEPVMPNGGMRQWFFDPKPESGSYSWPVLIIATEPNGKEVEYYLFEKVKLNVMLTDADFAPERLGKK